MFWRKPSKQVGASNMEGQKGFGKEPLTIAYTRHAQPDPGIAAFSYNTLLLPLYTPIGWAVQNKRQFKSAPSNPVVYQQQAITLTTIGNPGNLAGTFVSTPLIDTTSAPGALAAVSINPPGSFQIPNGGM